MHLEFKIFRDAVDSNAYPELLDEEIDVYLNEAMDRIVKTRYNKNNLYRKGFEETQKRTDDLKELVVSKFLKVSKDEAYKSTSKTVYKADLETSFSAATVDDPSEINGPFYDEDDYETVSKVEYMFYIKSSARSCKEDIDGKDNCCKWESLNLTQQDDLLSISGDPFNKPTASDPVGFFEDGELYIWTEDTGVIKNVLLTFIKVPDRMRLKEIPAVAGDSATGTLAVAAKPVTNCELSEHLHKEIVQMAVDISLENLQSPRVQTNIKNMQTIE